MTRVITLLLTTLISSSAVAAEGERPCRNDLMEHCADQIGNREQMGQCMRDNFSQFSEQCQATIMERRQNRSNGQRDSAAETTESKASKDNGS
jgi:hypothetical protein